MFQKLRHAFNLEIGARTQPIINELNPEITKGRSAVLVDKRLWWKTGEGEHSQADAQQLPFADNSADLLVSKDMFCSDGYTTSEADWRLTTESVGNFHAIAQEWARVTKPGGLAIIIEVATPSPELLGQLDSAFLSAGFTRDANSVLEGENIAVLFSNKRALTRQNYEQENAFAVVYVKP